MKAVKLNIEDKEHNVAILMSEEEAKQVCIRFGKGKDDEHRTKMGVKYKALLKLSDKSSDKSWDKSWEKTWHYRLWKVLVTPLYGSAALYREQMRPR